MSRRITIAAVVLALLLPLLTLPALRAQAQRMPGPRMSTRTKVLVLGGAALLYYLYRKHQAAQRTAANGQQRTPQLYRSKNGGIYYRDAQGKPVWLTVPSQSVQVPAADVQRYAPDYARYRGPAPTVPSGYRTQSFDQFDSNALVPAGPRR